MSGLLFTSISGWVLVVLVAFTSILPWTARRDALRAHFQVGCAIAPVCLVHAWPAMRAGWIRGADRTGLQLASARTPFVCGDDPEDEHQPFVGPHYPGFVMRRSPPSRW